MYLDTRGYVTVAIGNLVKNQDAAGQLPFWNFLEKSPATEYEIRDRYTKVVKMEPGKLASYYRLSPHIELQSDAMDELIRQRIGGEFLPALESQFPGFGNYPVPARTALMDMVYSLGAGGMAKYKRLRAACVAHDWTVASRECTRNGARESRNQWTADKFLEAARTQQERV